MSSSARVIRVAMPEVEGDRVIFRWTEPDQAPWQKRSSFEIGYRGVPLAAFSTELLLEIFMSLQWRVFGRHDGPVEVQLPIPMPRASHAWWRAFHEVENLEAGPLVDSGYSAWAGRPIVVEPREVAVFFGAGKDSTLARSVLAEVYGEEQVLLTQLVHPFALNRKMRNHLRARQQQLMIEPAIAGTRLAAAMIDTDYMGNFTAEGKAVRPHTNLYTMTSLPLLLHRGVRLASMSNEMTAYWVKPDREEGPTFGYSRSRPEVYAALSAHLARVSDIAIEYGNTHFPISELLSYRILMERYPQAFARMVMCVSAETDQRWCMSCKKCAQYVHFGLLGGRTFPEVSYYDFWSRSKYIQKLLEIAESGTERDVHTGNLPWTNGVSHSYHFASFSHTMARLRGDTARRLVPTSVHPVLDTLASAWGNRTYDDLEAISSDAIALAGTAMIQAVAARYAEHAPMRAGAFRSLPYMNTLVDYDFTRRMEAFGPAAI